MKQEKKRVCPVERAGSLDSRFRSWLQNPYKILKPYVKKGMTVLDMGCGPGFFTIPMAEMVGDTGRVIASDIQEGMLQKLSDKLIGTDLVQRIILHRCGEKIIGVDQKLDFVLGFYMIHELPDQCAFFKEIYPLMKQDGQVLIVEPPFHVSKTDFLNTLKVAEETGFMTVEYPNVLLSKSALLKKNVDKTRHIE